MSLVFVRALIVSFLMGLVPVEAYSQSTSSNKSSNQNYSSELRQMIDIVVAENLDDKATVKLSKYFPEKYFKIETSITFSQYPRKLPYASEVAFLKTLNNLPIINLRKYIRSVEITVFLSDRIEPNSEQQIASIIRKSLLLKPEDTILFDKLLLEFQSEDQSLINDIAKVESELKQKDSEIGSLTRERNDIAIQNTTNKTNYEAELAKNIELENQLSITKDRLAKAEGERDEASKAGGGALDHPRVLMIIGLAVLGLLSILAVFFLGFRGLSGSFNQMAKSIGDLGGSLSDIGSNALSSPDQQLLGDGEQVTKAITSGESGVEGLSAAELQALVLQVQENILSQINDNNLETLMTHISSLLANPVSFETGIASMELLGPDMANKIFASLGESQKRTIRKFLTSSVYSVPKPIALYNAGQALITFLSMESMSNNFESKNPGVTLLTSKLELQDQFHLAHKLSENALSRFMLYMPIDIVVEITKYSETASPEQAEKCLKAISKIAEAADDESLDAEIINTAEELLSEINEDKHRNYMNMYVTLGNNLSDSMSNQLKEIMGSASESLGKFLEKEILNTSTFYSLAEISQISLLTSLSNKYIAALLYDMDETKSERWTSLLSERRREAVSELKESFNDDPAYKRRRLLDESKNAVKNTLIAMKNKGDLIFAGSDTDEEELSGDGITAA